MKLSKSRYFIVGPTEAGIGVGDTIWQLCKTNKHRCLFDVYIDDQYEVVESSDSLKSIVSVAKKFYGCKRPTVI